MNGDALHELVTELATQIARAVVAELRSAEQPGMIDQSRSPLGRRRHIQAARRRIAANDGSAAQVGRRYLITREGIEAELAAQSARARKRAPKSAPAEVDELGALRSKYALERRAS